MGRSKVKIECILDHIKRWVTYRKRRNGVLKKLAELAILTKCGVYAAVFPERIVELFEEVRSGRTTVEKIQQQLQQQQKDEAAAAAAAASLPAGGGGKAIGSPSIVNSLPVIYSSERDVQYLIELMEFVKNYIGYNCITDADAMFDLSSDNGSVKADGSGSGKASALEDGADADADDDDEDVAYSTNGSSSGCDDDDTSAIAQNLMNTYVHRAAHPAPAVAPFAATTADFSVFQRMMMMPPVFSLPPALFTPANVAAVATTSDEDDDDDDEESVVGRASGKKRRRLTTNQHQ
jgi:hypothetical protein